MSRAGSGDVVVVRNETLRIVISCHASFVFVRSERPLSRLNSCKSNHSTIIMGELELLFLSAPLLFKEGTTCIYVRPR